MTPNLIDASAAKVMLDSALAAKESELSRGVLLGVLAVGAVVLAVAFMGLAHSSADVTYSAHLGYSDRSSAAPITVQPVAASSGLAASNWNS